MNQLNSLVILRIILVLIRAIGKRLYLLIYMGCKFVALYGFKLPLNIDLLQV